MPKRPDKAIKSLPVRHIKDVAQPVEPKRWLVRPLWAFGVGVVGGQPKSFKTWIATELAYAIATGAKALGRFEVEHTGPVLVFQAEDDLPSMRSRFEAIAQARGGRLDDAPVHLIDVPALYLDDVEQLRALRRTVADVHPRLLVLDPFVRLVKRSDENSAAEVSAVLGALREIQRSFDVAIILVHHMRKAASANVSQQLRGSGDFGAWSDSAIYITRHGDDRLLTIEHRAAAAPPSLVIRLDDNPSPHLVVVDANEQTPAAGLDPLRTAILERLRIVDRPQSTIALSKVLKVRKTSLMAVLESLKGQGLVVRDAAGWRIAATREPAS